MEWNKHAHMYNDLHQVQVHILLIYCSVCAHSHLWTLFPAVLLYLASRFCFHCRSQMLTAWPGTPSVRTCCASQATATLTLRLATSLYTSRRCRASWSATTAQRFSVSTSTPCLLWRCLRCARNSPLC